MIIDQLNKCCPCCRSDRTCDLSDVDSRFFRLLCSKCGYIQYATDETIDSTDYEESQRYENYHGSSAVFLWHHRYVLRKIQEIGLTNSSRILDFGCFDGFVVSKLRQLGFNAYGVDWNKKALATGLEKYDIEGRLSDTITGRFAAVLAMEVLEHFQSPEEFFNVLADKLDSGGFLFLSCPSSQSLYRPLADFPPHHFSRFSPKSLKLLVERFGFEVLEQEEQMSVLQLFRNWCGDRLRMGSSMMHSTGDVPLSPAFIKIREVFNSMSKLIEALLVPIDWVMKKLGFRYIGQVVVARKVS